jgi:hypothetical protein
LPAWLGTHSTALEEATIVKVFHGWTWDAKTSRWCFFCRDRRRRVVERQLEVYSDEHRLGRQCTAVTGGPLPPEYTPSGHMPPRRQINPTVRGTDAYKGSGQR